LSIMADVPQMMAIDQRKFDEAPWAIQQEVLFPARGFQFFL